MKESDSKLAAFTPQESWQAIHTTMDKARSSMYVAGTATILLLWGVISALGFTAQYVFETLAPDLTLPNPWLYPLLWGVLIAAGMAGSAIIGHHAGKKNVAGGAMRSAGIRVFLFWLAVAVAAFFVPGAAGMWTAEAAANIPRVSIGIAALGYILYGIMHRPVIAFVGAGIAVAFYAPSYVAGDAAPLLTAGAILVLTALSAAWIRKSGVL
ncbi:MAG: hypothetical protein F4X83_11200 [Chloroflexi bacterium]|nr:hypothetical protein [Chloroflexota bacterium]